MRKVFLVRKIKKFFQEKSSINGTKVKFSLKEIIISLQETLKENNKELNQRISQFELKVSENNKELDTKLSENNRELEMKLSGNNRELEMKLSGNNKELEIRLSEKMKTNNYQVVFMICSALFGMIALMNYFGFGVRIKNQKKIPLSAK